MKEIEIKQSDNVAEIKRNVISQSLVARKKLHKGHKCFQLDVLAMIEYGQSKEAKEKNEKLDEVIVKFITEVKTEKSMDISENKIRNKVVAAHGCIYETALNIKNVKIKFIQKLKK